MSSIKNLKKEINNSIGELIENIYAFEILNPDFDLKKSEKLIDESIALFDQLIVKVNARDKSKAKLTLGNVRKELNDEIQKINQKLNNLN